MSTIWTPSGEQPIRRDEPQPEAAAPRRPDAPAGGTEEEISEAELAAQMAEMQRQLVETPASVVVANHCIGLFQLAALHLDQQPPKLEEARLAIDALSAVLDGVGSRLGEDGRALGEALTQLRLGFVQVQNAAGGDT